jgi:hypothetical protein
MLRWLDRRVEASVAAARPYGPFRAQPDIVIKFLKNGRSHIILLMENKRGVSPTAPGEWYEGLADLKRYLGAARSKDLFSTNIPEFGMVGVGKYVKFYKRGGL